MLLVVGVRWRMLMVAGEKIALGHGHAIPSATCTLLCTLPSTLTVDTLAAPSAPSAAPPVTPFAAGRLNTLAPRRRSRHRPGCVSVVVTTARATRTTGRPLQPQSVLRIAARPPPAALDPGASADPAAESRARPRPAPHRAPPELAPRGAQPRGTYVS